MLYVSRIHLYLRRVLCMVAEASSISRKMNVSGTRYKLLGLVLGRVSKRNIFESWMRVERGFSYRIRLSFKGFWFEGFFFTIRAEFNSSTDSWMDPNSSSFIILTFQSPIIKSLYRGPALIFYANSFLKCKSQE